MTVVIFCIFFRAVKVLYIPKRKCVCTKQYAKQWRQREQGDRVGGANNNKIIIRMLFTRAPARPRIIYSSASHVTLFIARITETARASITCVYYRVHARTRTMWVAKFAILIGIRTFPKKIFRLTNARDCTKYGVNGWVRWRTTTT